jgi:CheY-like chemotaxis protein
MIDKGAQILVVDDEAVHIETIRRGLRLYGYRVRGVSNVSDARAILEGPDGATIGLVLSDLSMPGGSGRELVDWIRSERPELPVMVITGLNSSDDVALVRAAGVRILPKPLTPSQLIAAIEDLD